jgi:hypothetical protein
MNRPQSRFASFARKPSKAANLASMVLFLVGARSLDGITAETLARRYGVSLKDAEDRLARAKVVRG